MARLRVVPGGKPGPKTLPASVKKQRGTLRKGREAAKGKVPRVPPGTPKMPKGLPLAAKNEWRRLALRLRKVGLLTPVDTGPFSMLCIWWAQIEACVAELNKKNGRVSTTPNGHKQPSPHMTMLRQASAEYLKYADRFGLSPIARQALAGMFVPGGVGNGTEENSDEETTDEARVTDKNGKPI